MTVGRNLTWFFLTLVAAATWASELSAQTSRPAMTGMTRVPAGSAPRPGAIRRTSVRQEEMVDPLDMPAPAPRANGPAAAQPETRRLMPNKNAEAPQPLHEEIDTWLDHPQAANGGDMYYDDGYGYGGGCCGPMGCGPMGCGPFGMWGMGGCCPPRFYVRGEYLLWWTDGQRLPALVTTSTAGTARAAAGVLGQPNTTVLYGNQDVSDGSRSGGRGTAGFWISDCLAVEGDYIKLGDAVDNFNLASNAAGQPTIARPYFNAQTNLQDAELIAFNLNGAQLTGSVAIDTRSSFDAAGVFFRKVALENNMGCRSMAVDFLGGWRYARLNERIGFASTRTAVGTALAVPAGSTLALTESFETENVFNGLDLGVAMRSRRGVWTMDVTGRFAFGSIGRQTDINGQTTVTVPNQAAVVTPGGLLAQRTNVGRYRDDEFCFMPEVSVKAGLDIFCNMRLTAGYNFLAVTNVARAVDQIDSTVNTSQVSNQPLVGAARPSFTLRDSDFWAQGLSVGLEGEF